jgi:acyl-[acyl-carrier-protein] desaturase
LVAQQLGVYTVKDYADIVEHLVKRWRLEYLQDGLSSEGRQARDFVCGLPERMRRMQEKFEDRARKSGASDGPDTVQFSWVFGRQVKV